MDKEIPYKYHQGGPMVHRHTGLIYRLRWMPGSGRYHIDVLRTFEDGRTEYLPLGEVKKDYNLAGSLKKWKGSSYKAAVCGMVSRRSHALDCVLRDIKKHLTEQEMGKNASI